MKDSRIGESLWLEWLNDARGSFSKDLLVFYTEDHVDIDNDIVRRALASALQRDGISISLGAGYKAVEESRTTHGYAGRVDGEDELVECDKNGETRDGDVVDEIVKVTWVEIECQKA